MKADKQKTIQLINSLVAETRLLVESGLSASTIKQRNRVQVLQGQLIIELACIAFDIHPSNIQSLKMTGESHAS